MVRISDFPQLRLIAWSRPHADLIDEQDALALYERNWEYVDQAALTPEESAFIRDLTVRYGGGCFSPVTRTYDRPPP